MSEFSPKVIRRTDPTRIEVDWHDGHTSILPIPLLRGLCPCAGCVNEHTGVRTHDPASVPEDLTHVAVHLVGNYAITIQFSDGHSTGIFPYRFLRDSDPAQD